MNEVTGHDGSGHLKRRFRHHNLTGDVKHVESLEGPDVAHPRDWIVQQGDPTHRWVVPDARFRESYRPV